MLEHVFETFDPELDLGIVAEAKQDHAVVWLSLAKDEITEVLVSSQQDTLLGYRYREDFMIREPGRMLPGDSRSVVAMRPEVGLETRIGALVEQETHADAARGTLSLITATRRR